jgi:hypothetical protein
MLADQNRVFYETCTGSFLGRWRARRVRGVWDGVAGLIGKGRGLDRRRGKTFCLRGVAARALPPA